ncbi:hypothetical protein VNI00_007443 [Paramarasmius palmivorus]|uniref:Uncharacterized protein n=1 Tax=Paramarasmius palmivorus TaxID=297713 RepID=A0AAW0D3K7_9AGAR
MAQMGVTLLPTISTPSVGSTTKRKHSAELRQIHTAALSNPPVNVSKHTRWYRKDELVWVILNKAIAKQEKGPYAIRMWPGIITDVTPRISGVLLEAFSQRHPEVIERERELYECQCTVELLNISDAGRYITVNDTTILPFSVYSPTGNLRNYLRTIISDNHCSPVWDILGQSFQEVAPSYIKALEIAEQIQYDVRIHSSPENLCWGAERIMAGDMIRLACSRNALAPVFREHFPGGKVAPRGPGKRMREICKVQGYDPAFFGSGSRAGFFKVVRFDLDSAPPSLVGHFYELVDGDYDQEMDDHAIENSSSDDTPDLAKGEHSSSDAFQLLLRPVILPGGETLETLVPFERIAGRCYRGMLQFCAAVGEVLFSAKAGDSIDDIIKEWKPIWEVEGLIPVDVSNEEQA